MNLTAEQMNALKTHRLIWDNYELYTAAAEQANDENDPTLKDYFHWELVHEEMMQQISLINNSVPFIPLYLEDTNETYVGELRWDQYSDVQKKQFVNSLGQLKQQYHIEQQAIDAMKDHVIYDRLR
jgi:hypothetical protein